VHLRHQPLRERPPEQREMNVRRAPRVVVVAPRVRPRLPKRVHLATIWAVSIGSVLSAMFILVANSWMQHPVGYKLNHAGQPVLNNVWALFVNPTFVWGFVHVLLAALITGALVMLAVSAWYLLKRRHVESFHRTAKVALIVLIPTIVIQMSVGSQLGVVE